MELERLQAAWQKFHLEHPCEESPGMRVADIRRKVMERDRKFAREMNLQIICSLISLGFMLSWYDSRKLFYSNLGLIILLLNLAIMLTRTIILKFRSRVSHPERPRDEFLAEQRNKILARIALFRRNLRWFLPPSLLGLLLWGVAPVHSVTAKLVLVILVAIGYVIAYLGIEEKIRGMTALIEEINREIAYWERLRSFLKE